MNDLISTLNANIVRLKKMLRLKEKENFELKDLLKSKDKKNGRKNKGED